MKIDKGHQAYIQNLDLNKNNKNIQVNKDIKKTKNNSINIEISKSARKLAEKIREGENFSKRVEEIRKAVLNDTYKISVEEIADKMIDSINSQGDGKRNE